MNNTQALQGLKKEYHAVPIPKGLDAAIARGLEDGRAVTAVGTPQPSRTNNQWLSQVAAALIIVSVLFTVSINLFPTFADALVDIPLLGDLVKVLRFTEGRASGGDITDGANVKEMIGRETDQGQEIIIHFDGDSQATFPGYYDIRYSDNPSTLSFTISGVRMLSAQKDYEAMKQLSLVKDVYTLITLDDSMVRFNIVFNEAVGYLVEERADPSALVVRVQEDPSQKTGTIYTVRSHSYPWGESFGILEEGFWKREDYRILKDSGGAFLYEFGSFATKDQALAHLADLSGQIDLQLITEERPADALPTNIPVDHNLVTQPEVEESQETEQEGQQEPGQAFSVSVTADGKQFYGVVTVGTDQLEIHNTDQGGALYGVYPYDQVTLRQTKGEASFVLVIEVGETTVRVSGVYGDFFEVLGGYTDFTK